MFSKSMKKINQLEVTIFYKMYHQIPFFGSLFICAMVLNALWSSFVKTLATFGIIYTTDPLLESIALRPFASVDSPLIF